MGAVRGPIELYLMAAGYWRPYPTDSGAGLRGAAVGGHTAQFLGFLYLGVVNTRLSYSLLFRGIGRLPISKLPMLGLVRPMAGLLLG